VHSPLLFLALFRTLKVPSNLDISFRISLFFCIALVRYICIVLTVRVLLLSYNKIIVYCVIPFILINLQQFKTCDVEIRLKSMVVSWY